MSFYLDFIKMHGIGNDFVVLDAIAAPLPAGFDATMAAPVLCDRHRGVGGDGLLILDYPTHREAAVRMRMWNPDGTEDMCGNGLRCIARLAAGRGHVSAPEFRVETLAGLRTAAMRGDLVEVGMGLPSFEAETIPLRRPDGDATTAHYELPVADVAGSGLTMLRGVTSLSTGTAHTVIFGEALPDDASFERLSPLIEHHPWFPERTSIMWTRVVDRNRLELRIWERGAGETLACGTGACAAAVAAQVNGYCDAGVEVASRGGTLRIDWTQGAEIRMAGPAREVYRGRWNGFGGRP